MSTTNIKCAFFVTSAIGNEYGIFSTEERYEQLLETIHSIDTYAPRSDIYLIDMSDDKLPDEFINNLSLLTFKTIFLHEDSFVQYVKSNEVTNTKNDSNLFHKKALGEIYGSSVAIKEIANSGKKYDVVFKLTGRHTLNENFDVRNFLHDAVVTKKWTKDMFFSKKVLLTRLWAFPFSKIDAIGELFELMFKDTMRMLVEEQRLQILEETFMSSIIKYNVPHVEIPTVGINVIFAFDGTRMEE